ncbi:allatostatin-A receptor-like [Antedon mediterranea]|uniref:allatostatin-A receptor-like n=1 Tax=Antedon mediterranea TaxID=105859 RepID=UPI003AF6B297
MSDWDDFIQSISYTMVDKIVITIFMPIVVIFGIIGNIMIITVIAKNQRMRTSVYVYLANLAIADMLFLTLAPDLSWTSIVNGPIRDEYNIGVEQKWICKFNFYVVDTTVQVAIFTIVAMSIERYRAICHPITFRSNKSRSMLRATQICCLIWCITLAWQSRKLVWIEMITHQFPWPDMYNGVPNLTKTCVYCNDEFDCKIDETLWVFDTCLTLTLILVVVGLYTAILVKLRKSKFSAANSTGSKQRSKSETKVFLTVFLIVTVYIVCIAPFEFLTVVLIVSDYGDDFAIKTINILRVALYINSSVNPIIYNAVNNEFRRAFQEMFNCKKNEKSKPTSDNTDRTLTAVSCVSHSMTGTQP